MSLEKALERFGEAFAEAMNPSPLRRLVWSVQHAYRRVRRVVEWLPVLWADADWDSAFLLRIMRYKISRIRRHFETEGVGVHGRKSLRRMREAEELLRRLDEDDYATRDLCRHWARWGHLTIAGGIRRGPAEELIISHRKTLSPGEEERAWKEYKAIEASAKRMKDEEKKRLFHILNRHMESWWD